MAEKLLDEATQDTALEQGDTETASPQTAEATDKGTDQAGTDVWKMSEEEFDRLDNAVLSGAVTPPEGDTQAQEQAQAQAGEQRGVESSAPGATPPTSATAAGSSGAAVEPIEMVVDGVVHRLDPTNPEDRKALANLGQLGYKARSNLGVYREIADVLSSDPELARQVMDVIHRRGQPEPPPGQPDGDEEPDLLTQSIQETLGKDPRLQRVFQAMEQQERLSNAQRVLGRMQEIEKTNGTPDAFEKVYAKMTAVAPAFGEKMYRQLDSDPEMFASFYLSVRQAMESSGELAGKAQQHGAPVRPVSQPSFRGEPGSSASGVIGGKGGTKSYRDVMTMTDTDFDRLVRQVENR